MPQIATSQTGLMTQTDTRPQNNTQDTRPRAEEPGQSVSPSRSLSGSRVGARRILSIGFPFLETDHVNRRRMGSRWRLEQDQIVSGTNRKKLVITSKKNNALRIVAVSEEALCAGLFCGQALGDARALIPDIDCVERDEAAVETLLNQLADWCDRYTPLVSVDPEPGPAGGGLFLDITGCSHLFGGEAAMLDDMAMGLNRLGFAARFGIADTPGAAWAMSRFGPAPPIHAALAHGPSSGMQKAWHRRVILPPGRQADLLQEFSLQALRLDRQTVDGLRRMGLKTIACIADLPRAPLVARFGKHVTGQLDLAMGIHDEPLSPRLPAPELASEKRFSEPLTRQEDIEQAILLLARNLGPLLEKHGLGVRQLNFKLFRVDGERLQLSVVTASPVRHHERMARLFFEKIAGLHDDLDVGYGFDILRLEVARSEPLSPAQTDLVDQKASSEELSALIDRLGARLGHQAVTRFELADTHIPERSFSRLAIHTGSGQTRPGNTSIEADPAHENHFGLANLTRPVLLLQRPESIDVMAEVPEGAPIRFRWRKVMYDVVKSEGPERIACEWWKDGRTGLTRDYFRVEDRSGYRFWMFRHGLYERETGSPHWYMHGLFP